MEYPVLVGMVQVIFPQGTNFSVQEHSGYIDSSKLNCAREHWCVLQLLFQYCHTFEKVSCSILAGAHCHFRKQ